jgi:hypothetical protein
MAMNVELRKSAGLCLVVAALLGFSLVSFAMPERVAAQARPTGQPGAHPMNAGLPKLSTDLPGPMNAESPKLSTGQRDRNTNSPYWDGRQMFPNLQACSANPYSLSYDPLAAFSIGAQASVYPWRNGEMQGIPSGPDLMSWYGDTSGQAAWWPDSSANLNPVLGFCGGFQGWLP